jgi:hypothetical protein
MCFSISASIVENLAGNLGGKEGRLFNVLLGYLTAQQYLAEDTERQDRNDYENYLGHCISPPRQGDIAISVKKKHNLTKFPIFHQI